MSLDNGPSYPWATLVGGCPLCARKETEIAWLRGQIATLQAALEKTRTALQGGVELVQRKFQHGERGTWLVIARQALGGTWEAETR